MLHYKISGKGQPVVILHGLFGTLDNWKTFSNTMKDSFTTILIDLRNHGRSFWSDEFNYKSMAGDVIQVLDSLGYSNVSIIGHSMGGKLALTISLLFPERVNRLVIIDIGIKKYLSGHSDIFEAILNMNPEKIHSRKEAEEILSKSIKNQAIRQFLLKSLSRKSEGGYRWKTNFQSLYDNYATILEAININNLDKKVLFVKGRKSNYIEEADITDIRAKFNDVEFVEIDSGHWVHAEKPNELFESISAFLK